MKDLISLAGAAKARMDTGFSQVGRSLSSEDETARLLMTLAARCAAAGNAVTVLAMNHHPNEALPLVRSLFEMALRMRAAAADESKSAALLLELSAARWETYWVDRRLDGWMNDFDVPEAARKNLADLCRAHVSANAAGLPWGHVFASEHAAGFSEEGVLRLSALALGHALKALEVRWPGFFEGSHQIWSQALTRPSA